MAVGSFRWTRSRKVARREPVTGAVLRWYGTTEYVHDRHLAEAALRGSEARLRALLDQLLAGVALAEVPSGRLLYHNTRAVDLLGHPLLESADVSSYARYGAVHEDGRAYAPEDYPIARARAARRDRGRRGDALPPRRWAHDLVLGRRGAGGSRDRGRGPGGQHLHWHRGHEGGGGRAARERGALPHPLHVHRRGVLPRRNEWSSTPEGGPWTTGSSR
jgi:PAS domain-containing protein